MWKVIKQIIKGYYQWFKFKFNKEYREKMKVEAERRIKICESCEFFWKPARNCMICGCFMDVKTKMDLELDENGKSIDGCAEKKW
jgi:translation initiation factor IF-2